MLCYFKRNMDPNSSVGKICLGEDNRILLNDRIESHGEWETPECRDTASSKQKKEVKAFAFYRMETEEVSESQVVLGARSERWRSGRSFMRLTKGIADFGNGVITIYPELDPFLDNSDKTKKSKDDWELILDGIDFGDMSELEEPGLPPFVCKLGKCARNKKRSFENYQMNYFDEGPSLTNGKPLTQEEATHEAIAIDIYKRI
ncbi:hypothetical protein Tco_0719932 [Tanacetum coccineum]